MNMPRDLSDPSLYTNRDLSLLAFNQRVLEMATDSTVPLLERRRLRAQQRRDQILRARSVRRRLPAVTTVLNVLHHLLSRAGLGRAQV